MFIYSQIKSKEKIGNKIRTNLSARRLKSRNGTCHRNFVNQSMKNFETHCVTIDLKEINAQSTFQSTRSKESSKTHKKHTKISNLRRTLMKKFSKSRLK